jgi:catecholate siderophore receptor
MKNTNKLLLPLSAIFALTSVGHTQNNTQELSPLSVVGSESDIPTLSSGMKTSMPTKDIPQSLSIMTSDQIKAQGLKSIGDIIDYTPGVNTSQGEGHRDAAVIRGVRTTQDFYRDGIRDDVQYYRPLYNIDQVEVLRGPNALISGFGGAYGIINRVSKKGVIGESFNTISGSIDTFGETNVQLDSNYEIGEDQAFRINMFGESLENHRDYYYGDSFGVNPTMKYVLGDGSTLDLSYEYLNQERFIDRGIPTGSDGKPVESLKDFVFGDPTENFSTHEAHIFKAIYEHELTDSLSGRLTFSHSDHDKLYQNLYASSYDAVANTVKLDGYVDTTQRETTTFSYQVNGEFEMGDIVHNLIAGLEFIETSNNNDRYNADWTPDDNADADTETFSISRLMVNRNSGVNTSGNTTVNNYTTSLNDKTLGDLSVVSAFLLDEIELTDSLDLVLGVRFDKMDYDVQDVKNGANYTDSDDTISPRAGLIFDLMENTSIYASYSESYQQIKGDQYASLNAYDNKSDPNTFENTEFGVKYDLPNGLSFTAAFFNVEANKPQTDDNGATFYKEKSDVSGFELQLLGALTDKWYLSASYTSLDAESSSGGRLREAPEDMFSIWNNYLLSDRLAVNLGVIYQGESQIKSSATPILPDYTRLDVGATYALTDNTRLQVNIENLTDELYFPNSHSTHQASVGAPVNATFGITSSF